MKRRHTELEKEGRGWRRIAFVSFFFIICTEIFLCVFFRQVERTSIAGRDRYTWSSSVTLKQRKRQQGAGGQGVEFKWNGPGPCGSLEDMRAVEGRSDVLWDWLSNNRPLQRIYGELIKVKHSFSGFWFTNGDLQFIRAVDGLRKTIIISQVAFHFKRINFDIRLLGQSCQLPEQDAKGPLMSTTR